MSIRMWLVVFLVIAIILAIWREAVLPLYNAILDRNDRHYNGNAYPHYTPVAHVVAVSSTGAVSFAASSGNRSGYIRAQLKGNFCPARYFCLAPMTADS